MANNIFQQRIKPVVPKVLEKERIFVYVPKATTKDAGIAYYNPDDFTVSNLAKVSIIWPYAHDDKFGLVKIAKDSAGYLKFSEDGNNYLEVDITKLDIHTNSLIDTKITSHNTDETAHNDIRLELVELKNQLNLENLIPNIVNENVFVLQSVTSNDSTRYEVLNDSSGIHLKTSVDGYTPLINEIDLINNQLQIRNKSIADTKIVLYNGNITLSSSMETLGESQLKITPSEVTINGEYVATKPFVESEILKISSVKIRNIEPNLIIEANGENIQEVATQYIIDNYQRNPQTNDGLFITRTDLKNDVIKYAYFNSQWINIGLNNVDLSNYVDLSSSQSILGNKDFTGNITKNGVNIATVNDVAKSEENARKILVLGATGTIGEKANFVVEDVGSYLEFRNNLTEFIFSGIIPVTGEIDLTKEVTIDFGDTSYYLFSAVDTTKRLTLGDLDFALRESLVTGYNYLFRTVFFQNADQVGFAVLPDKEDVLSLDSDQMDNYLVDGGLPQGQLAICKKVITNGYSEGGIYRFKITYPSTYEWEELSSGHFKRLTGTIDNIINYATSLEVGGLYSVSGYVQNVDGFINVFTQPVLMYKPTENTIYCYNTSIYKDSNNIEFEFGKHTILNIDSSTGYIINAELYEPGGEVDTSDFVDLTSAQKITGAKTFKQILLAQTEWTEPVTTFSKSTNYVFPNDGIYINVDPNDKDTAIHVRFVCGNNGLFCIIAEDGSMIADYTGQTPLGTSAIYRIAYGGDRLYVTGRNGIFWINIDTFDFNNPVWSELKTGITGYVYAVAHYHGEVNGSYNDYMLFGTGRNVIMYNEDTDTWGSSISLGVTSGYAEFFLPYWKDDEQVYFFFARNIFGYFNPRTGAIVKNTDYTISGTAYTYYLDGNLVYLQDSNKTIGVYDLDTMTRVKSSELGNVSWSGYIYTIQQNYDGNLIIGGANSNIVIIDKDTFEAKEVFELKYGSLTNFAFNWNGDWYYVTDTAISSPSNVQKDILNFIPAGTRVAEFTLLNENWVEEVDEKTGDKIYYYDLSLGSLGKTASNHATVGLAHSLMALEAYENTQKIINANIFSTYDLGSNIRLYAKDIDTSDVGNSMIITVEVYE